MFTSRAPLTKELFGSGLTMHIENKNDGKMLPYSIRDLRLKN